MFFYVFFFFFVLQESTKIIGFIECGEIASLAEIYDDKYLFQLNTAHMSVRTRKVKLQFSQKYLLSKKKKKKRSRAYCPKGRQFFHNNFNVLVVVLIRVFIDAVVWGLADWLVGLDKDGFCSFDVTATVRARMSS